MSGNNPWSEFERGIPERDYEPATAGSTEPAVDPQSSAQELFDSLFSTEEMEPSPDVYVIDESPSSAADTSAWGRAPQGGAIPEFNFTEQESPRRGLRIAIVSALCVAGVALAVFGTVFAVGHFGNVSPPETAASPEPTDSLEVPAPEEPESRLSTDLSKDLSFAAEVPSSASLKNVSLALDGNKDWSREDSEGVTTYKNVNGCVVNWSQKDQSFDRGVTDFEASYEALTGVTGGTDFMVSEYGYWTDAGGVSPTGKTEVVEARVDQDGKAVVVAARAIVSTGEVGLVWMSCDDPDVLDKFASSIRFDVGFILAGLRP